MASARSSSVSTSVPSRSKMTASQFSVSVMAPPFSAAISTTPLTARLLPNPWPVSAIVRIMPWNVCKRSVPMGQQSSDLVATLLIGIVSGGSCGCWAPLRWPAACGDCAERSPGKASFGSVRAGAEADLRPVRGGRDDEVGAHVLVASLMRTDAVVVLLLSLTVAVAALAPRVKLPVTVGLVLVGLAINVAGVFKAELSPDLVFYVLLPPVIFEASFNLRKEDFVEDWKRTVSLAF